MKQVAINVHRGARKPLHTEEVAKRIIESGRGSGLKGKTHEATIAAMLAVGSKPGEPFERADKSTYKLVDDVSDATTRIEQKRPKPANSNAKNRAKTSGGKTRVTPSAR